jgi:hypothetical protein
MSPIVILRRATVLAALALAFGACSDGSSSSGQPAASTAAFPFEVSADGRLLVDQKNKPFLVQSDAAWGLIAAATIEDAEFYLENRKRKGFNAVLVRLLEHRFVHDPPRNVYGDAPFTTPGDFSTPNESYFAHVDDVIRKANEIGILVLLAPAYLGFEGGDEGWFTEMKANGTAKLRDYGRYLGRRYKAFPNILWVEAGDFDPPTPELVRAVAQGILEQAPDQLHTAHCGRGKLCTRLFSQRDLAQREFELHELHHVREGARGLPSLPVQTVLPVGCTVREREREHAGIAEGPGLLGDPLRSAGAELRKQPGLGVRRRSPTSAALLLGGRSRGPGLARDDARERSLCAASLVPSGA